MRHWTAMERWLTLSVAAIGLLMFFFPLLVIQAPLVGEQDVSGYDIFSKVRQFSDQVKKPSSEPERPNIPSRNTPSRVPDLGLPLSLRMAWLIPVNVIAAFILAAITLLGTAISMRLSGVAATGGAILAIVALLHVVLANSDLHSWMQASMKTGTDELKGNPFAAIAEQVGNLILTAFRIKPGPGLYVLGVCLGVAAIVAKTGILTNFRVVRVGGS
jgi:hypothetical protein